MNRQKTIFITGTSSGLGKASAQYFAAQGWTVIATMRTPEKDTTLHKIKGIHLLPLDVTNVASVQQATTAALQLAGKIDVVFNNAGMGAYGALELATEADIDWQFQVNTRGVINVIRAFLPHFRANGGGMFINASSFMGITTAVPLGSLYNMSKFALEGLTEGLYYELKPFNIDLRLIEPGGFTETNFVNNIRWSEDKGIPAYNKLQDKLMQLMNNPGKQVDDVIDLVKVVHDLAERKSNQFRTVIGAAGNGLMALRNSVPIEEFLEKMYQPFA